MITVASFLFLWSCLLFICAVFPRVPLSNESSHCYVARNCGVPGTSCYTLFHLIFIVASCAYEYSDCSHCLNMWEIKPV